MECTDVDQCYRYLHVAWLMVYVSVSWSLMTMSLATTAEPIEMTFRV